MDDDISIHAETKFSVLMSTYKNDNAEHFKAALESLKNQSIQATEIVLVEDGPLTPGLYEVIKTYKKLLPIVSLPLLTNSGLAIALHKGVLKCQYDYIARMDTDDICTTDRFKIQLSYLNKNPNVDVLGGFIAEFHNDPNETSFIRKVPLSSEEVQEFSKWRTPMNHMTVMMKKQIVLDAGNYGDMSGVEDYVLWLNMIKNNAVINNVEDILVQARVGNDMIGRRRGVNFFKLELRLIGKMKADKHVGVLRSMVLIAVRAVPRLLPHSVLAYIYKLLRK